MLQISIKILFFLSFVKCQTQRDVQNNPNDFHMFENFEMTKKVYINETKMVKKLQDLKENLVRRKQVIDKFIDFNKKFQDVHHPIEAYNLMKLVTLNLTRLQTELKSLESKEKLIQDLPELAKDFPTLKDWDGAAAGITKLQQTYRLNLKDLSENGLIQYTDSNGEKRSFASQERLTSVDFSTLAMKAKMNKDYATAIIFLREALRLMPKEEGSIRAQTKEVKKRTLKLKKDLTQLNNGYLSKWQVRAEKDFIVLPYMIDENLKKKKKQPKFVTDQVLEDHPFLSQRNVDPMANVKNDFFAEVCRRGQIMPRFDPNRQNSLNCRFLHHADPYLKLGPFKEEYISVVPYAVVFHDILSQFEMDHLIESARPELSMTRSSQINSHVLAEHEYKHGNKRRTVAKTVQAWLTDVIWPDYFDDNYAGNYAGRNFLEMKDPILWKLLKKIELATQLQTQSHYSASRTQITNYGLGGLCETHVDPHGYLEGAHVPPEREYLKLTGDMLGTFMAWLEDTPAGGGTAYICPGVEGVVMPEKGAAAFWYDLFANGNRDGASEHGGCPVLKGSKWILNKWMYYFDNYKKFPCQLDQMASYDAPNAEHYFK